MAGQSRLLTIPRELRDEIYGYLAYEDVVIYDYFDLADSIDKNRVLDKRMVCSKMPEPGLLRANHQLHAEYKEQVGKNLADRTITFIIDGHDLLWPPDGRELTLRRTSLYFSACLDAQVVRDLIRRTMKFRIMFTTNMEGYNFAMFKAASSELLRKIQDIGSTFGHVRDLEFQVRLVWSPNMTFPTLGQKIHNIREFIELAQERDSLMGCTKLQKITIVLQDVDGVAWRKTRLWKTGDWTEAPEVTMTGRTLMLELLSGIPH